MKKSIIISLITLFTTTCFSQNFDKQKLNDYFLALENSNKFMGSVAISENGKIVYTKSIGFSNVEAKTKSDEDTKYRIGSVSKMFTSVLILKAVEEKKTSLDKKIDAFFPKLKNANKITLRNLLNHSSGIHSFTDNEDYLSWNTKPISKEQLLEKIVNDESDFEPNTKNQYSNANYVLLTFILEEIYNKPYSKILEKNIIKPLKLQNTYFGTSSETTNNLAKSYTFSEKWNLENETDSSVPLGAGAIVSTPKDLILFINGLFEGKIIKKETLKEMTTFTNKYGLGLFDLSFEKHSGIGHDGSIDGYKSIVTIFPEEKMSFAITSNASNYQLDLVTKTILNAQFNKSIEIPNFNKVNHTTEQLNQFEGTYSNKNLPFKLTVSQQNLQLFAQATGQASLPLETVEENVFTFDKAGIKLSFDIQKKCMTLNQSGHEFELTKE